MNFSRNQLIILAVIAAIVLFFALVFLGILPGSKMREPQVNLTFWGVMDDPAVFEEIFNEYKKIAPNVTIEYRKIAPENYEGVLIDALAAGEGPDLLMFHSSWLPKHGNKIVPATAAEISATKVKQLFPQVVWQDFVSNDQVYSLPLFIDTLALYYNRDIFDYRGVALPPKTWGEFRQTVLSRRVASAFGGTSSTMRAADLISLLLLQSGAKLPSVESRDIVLATEAGVQALNFYLQFAAPKEKAEDAFAKQSIGMMFDYGAARSSLKSKNPFLNFAVAEAPQFHLDAPINIASYYGLAVAKKADMSSLKRKRAWDFIIFLTTNEAVAEKYLQSSGRPPALRSLIAKYLEHPELGVFSRQALTARSWRQEDPEAVARIFDNMIKLTQDKTLKPQEALRRAEEEIAALMSGRQ